MTDWAKIKDRFPNKSVDDVDKWETCRVSVPVIEIAYFVAIFEAYENHFLVRTEQRGVGLLKIWYPKSNRELLDQVLINLGSELPLEILGYAPGMDGLDEVFPE